MNMQSIKDKIDATLNKPATPTGTFGIVLSAPGSEQTILDTSTIKFMECTSADVRAKKRYVIVEKGVNARDARDLVDSTGNLAHIVTKSVFNLMLNMINNIGRQLKKAQQDNDVLNAKVETYTMLINGLRKNGIID